LIKAGKQNEPSDSLDGDIWKSFPSVFNPALVDFLNHSREHSMSAKNSYLLAALFTISLSAFAVDEPTSPPKPTDPASDRNWGDASFDDACTGFSAQIASRAAAIVAQNSARKAAFKPTDGK
jgi:hypothetical protein